MDTHVDTHLTGEKGDFVEGALQLSHENVHKTIFGQMPCFFGTLVINHHFLLLAQLNLHRRQTARKRRELIIQQKISCAKASKEVGVRKNWNFYLIGILGNLGLGTTPAFESMTCIQTRGWGLRNIFFRLSKPRHCKRAF